MASVIGRKRPWSSESAARRFPSLGSRCIIPVTRKGGIEMIASSFVFGVRSSGTGSTGVVVTANRTESRLIWAKAAVIGSPCWPNSSTVTSSRIRNGSSARLRMSVTRCWRVRMNPCVIRASV